MNCFQITKYVMPVIGKSINVFVLSCGLAFYFWLFSSAGVYAKTPEQYLAANTIQYQKPFSEPNRAILPSHEFRYVQVPDLTGEPIDSAKVIIRKSGFTLGAINYVESALPAGMVISQKPAPKDQPRVLRGSVISLDVSKPMMSVVPNVIGQPFQSARSTLRKAGFTTIGHVPDSLKWRGVVSIQNPKGRTLLERGAIVELTLVVKSKPEPIIPDSLAPSAPPLPSSSLSAQLIKVLLTGGAIIILAGGSFLWRRMRAGNLKSSVEKQVTVYTNIDYGSQHLNAESLVSEDFAGNGDLSIRLMPDKGVQEIQVQGSLVQSE
jgi:hypothetical protein